MGTPIRILFQEGKSRKGPKMTKKFERTSGGRKQPGFQKDDGTMALEYKVDPDFEKDFEKDLDLIEDTPEESSTD